MNLEDLRKSLLKHEGIRLQPYEDSEGVLSIGIGKNLEKGITLKQAHSLLEDDIEEAITELDRSFKGWRNHNDARQNVLAEMCFNLGPQRLAGFKLMWAALDCKDYAEAAKQMLDSKWARQVKGRAITLAAMMATGNG